jgi:uncharacterized membrane protein YebE (DUF533 family)
MSILDYHDSYQKKINRAFLVHLVYVSKADGVISESEKKVIRRLGRKMGFVDEEISQIIEKPDPDTYYPPYELIQRFEHLTDVIRITLADGVITDDERRITQCYAVASGFTFAEADFVIELIKQAIAEGKDEEEMVKAYRKSKK